MPEILLRAVVLAMLSAPLLPAAAADGPVDTALAFLQAENHFDLPALDALLADGFVEISPRGQVDERAAVLGFYAPQNKVQSPPLMLEPARSHEYGDAAVVVVPIGMQIGGQLRPMTATITLKRFDAGWRLLAAAYTPQPAR